MVVVDSVWLLMLHQADNTAEWETCQTIAVHKRSLGGHHFDGGVSAVLANGALSRERSIGPVLLLEPINVKKW